MKEELILVNIEALKSIYLAAEDVRNVLDGQKSSFRYPIKPQPPLYENGEPIGIGIPDNSSQIRLESKASMWTYSKPYKIGEIIFVKETWADHWLPDGFCKDRYVYKADGIPQTGYYGCDKQSKVNTWMSPIYMPREAARIFLRVTDIKVERLQDMRLKDFLSEGISIISKFEILTEASMREQFIRKWNKIYAYPRKVNHHSSIDHYECYPWEEIRNKREGRIASTITYGNPWVWVVKFEKSK